MKLTGFVLFILCVVQANAQFDFPLDVRFDSAWTYKNLKLIPVKFVADPGVRNAAPAKANNMLSLEDAMKQKKVSVKEIASKEGSDKSVLVVRNLSKNNIVVNSGDVITGGKQDRMVSETTIVPPGRQKKYLNVFCVEKGRWDNKAKSFRYYAQADHKLKNVMDVKRSQREVWKAIDDRYRGARKRTETAAYKDAPKATAPLDSGYIKFFTRKFIESDRNFAGFIAVTDTSIIATNLYATADLHDMQFAANLVTYVDVAVQRGNTPIIKDGKVEAFISPILSDEKTRNKFLEKRGRVFKSDGKIIHIVAYGD
jgi:hypothetical protein